MLISLAYLIPRRYLDSVLGSVTAYPLTEDFTDAWDALPGSGDDRTPPYAALATGLIAATGQPVRLFGEGNLDESDRAAGNRVLLLTSDDAVDSRLRTATRAWERHIRGGEGSSTLVERLPKPEPARAFSDFVDYRRGQVPVAPNWVFRTAAWKIMRALAAEPLHVGGTPLNLRIDTDGSLLTWDDTLVHTKKNHSMYGMGRVTVRLITRAGIDDLVLCFDAHLSRISPGWYGRQTRHTWVLRSDAGKPLLRLPVRWHRNEETKEYAAGLDPAITAILEACQLEPLTLPAELPSVPGAIRPQLAFSRFHTLGNGLGPRFMFYLHKHIQRTLEHLVPLRYEVDKSIKLPKQVKKYPIGGIPADGVGPSGYKRVTLVCAYSTPSARKRMLVELEALAGVPIRPQQDGPAVAINERLDVVAHWCPDLLSHDTVNRSAHLRRLEEMASDPDRLIVVWAETEYHPDVEPPELDAKPHLRRILGHLGIPSQFLATAPQTLPSSATPRNPSEEEIAAQAALRDLLRTAGILDSRVPDALGDDTLPNALSRPTLLVGVHVRRQQTGKGEPVLVVGMVAVYLDPAELASCRMLAYSDRRGHWVQSAGGITDFHASAIGSTRFGRTDEKALRTRKAVEARLAELAEADMAGIPMVIFVDAPATRTIWPGLQDACLGDGPLPGDLLRSRGGDVAVVRLNTSVGEIGRPVTRVEAANNPADPHQPAAPGRKIYRSADSALPSWLFPGTSVQIRAKGGDRGARQTRWTLQANKGGRQQLGKPWHSYTAKEILIVEQASWTPEALATLTARLCEQAISWDSRTTLPVPLHLAVSADKDHPEYRAPAGPDEDRFRDVPSDQDPLDGS